MTWRGSKRGGPWTLELEPTDLTALTTRVVEEIAHSADRHQIQLDADGPLVGEWDPSRLERVIVNLLDNAVKYSPEGGEIQVRIRHEERDGNPTAVLTVQDRGVGIPPADLPHVFDQFRGSNVVGQISGTGLGLAGVRQIVEEHGGTVAIESEEGQGTKATVAIPIETGGRPASDEEGDRGTTDAGLRPGGAV